MDPISIWFISYFIPVIITIIAIITIPSSKPGTLVRSSLVHSGLLVSIIISQYFIFINGLDFPFKLSVLSISLLILAIIFSVMILGKFGLLYSFSAFLQQLCMVSIAFILSPALPKYLIILLIIPMYSIAHLLQPKKWRIKVPLTFMFGLIFMLIFLTTLDFYLNFAIHNIVGSIAIYFSLAFTESEFKIKRKSFH